MGETATPTKTPPAAPVPAGQPATPPVAPEDSIKHIEFEDYKFDVDTELLDDVELLEMIDGIENGEKPALIIELLKKLIGNDGYEAMKAYFIEKDGRFKMSKLAEIYKVIFENFDPKD